MAKAKILRIASGLAQSPFSGIWRIVADRGEIYFGISKASMGIVKLSLHSSGIWVFAATKQSGATFENGNRRAKQWLRPMEHAPGVTRGPSILVPRTSIGSRKISPNDVKKQIQWYQSPNIGEVTEFSFYFVRVGFLTEWSKGQTILGSLPIKGGELVVLAETRIAPTAFIETCEKLLRENVFHVNDLSGIFEESFLWITESTDALRVPIIVDLPVPITAAFPILNQ